MTYCYKYIYIYIYIYINSSFYAGSDFDTNFAQKWVKLSKMKVTGTIKRHGKHKKISVIKFKRRKHYMRSHGHKQSFTEIKIESIK